MNALFVNRGCGQEIIFLGLVDDKSDYEAIGHVRATMHYTDDVTRDYETLDDLEEMCSTRNYFDPDDPETQQEIANEVSEILKYCKYFIVPTNMTASIIRNEVRHTTDLQGVYFA